MGFETEMDYGWVTNLGDGTESKFHTSAHLSLLICELKQLFMFVLLYNPFLFSFLSGVCGLCMIIFFYFDSCYFQNG